MKLINKTQMSFEKQISYGKCWYVWMSRLYINTFQRFMFVYYIEIYHNFLLILTFYVQYWNESRNIALFGNQLFVQKKTANLLGNYEGPNVTAAITSFDLANYDLNFTIYHFIYNCRISYELFN